MRRFVVLAFGCLAIFFTQWYTQHAQSDAATAAHAMLGESWYQIRLEETHVGYMHANAYRDHLGQWHFDTTTHFALEENAPNTIAKHLIFAAYPPYPLLSGRYINRTGDRSVTTQLASLGPENGHLLSASIERGPHSNVNALDWGFDLPSFVAFEVWLAQTPRAPGQEYLLKGPDFERLRLIPRTYRVVEQTDAGYVVATNAPFAATTTRLDQNLKPIELSMAGLFAVNLSSEADAIALQTLPRKTNYLFPIDRRIDAHYDLARLKLKLHTDAPKDLPSEIELSAAHSSTQSSPDDYRGEELRFPITHPRIQRLVQQAQSRTSAEDASIVSEDIALPNFGIETLPARLVDVAHQQIAYAEEEPAGSVLVALAEGQGECTDFADLYTTLARAAGYPARTIYGLAYKDGAQPAFMFHAWNEVYSNRRWHTVDPTWNQVWADATHMPLTDIEAARMMRANNTLGVRFEVLEMEYVDSAAAE